MKVEYQTLGLHREIANAVGQLDRSTDFATVGEQLGQLLRANGLGFTSLSVHLIDRKQETGRLYSLWPGPARWVTQDSATALPPLQVHLEQQARMWQESQAGGMRWCLIVPTTQGVVEVTDSRPEAFTPQEQELLSSLAPFLQLLAIRHRDMELLESLSVQPPHAERSPRRPVARQRPDESDLFEEIVAQSAAMRRVTELARLSATTDYAVLLLGESGTGKDLLARAIHAYSRRRAGPLVVVNSARLSSGVEDSELFGHTRGAFTGASQETSGLVAAAHRGTLFLDEIGELAPTSQAKMLRCLETGEVRRVGDTHTHKVDIRLIAATNRDLRRAVASGTFREDLYYRLAIITILIPPLRERPEDILPLVERFLRQIGEETAREPRIAPAALDLLVRFTWPGNARQLDSCLRHAALLAGDDPIAEEHLPEDLNQALGPGAAGAPLSLSVLERQHILEVMAQCGRDRQRAQQLLGISRATLQRRLKEYGVHS